MWAFEHPLGGTPHQQADPAQPPRHRAFRRRLIGLVSLGLLLLVALLGGWAYLAFFRVNTAGLEGIFGEWKHEKNKMILTVEFRRGLFGPYTSYKWNRDGASGSGEATFTVIDSKTLALEGGPGTITIDSFTNEKLVLSGQEFGDLGWPGGILKNFDKTEFTKQK